MNSSDEDKLWFCIDFANNPGTGKYWSTEQNHSSVVYSNVIDKQ
jgi:hypothetical protein